MKRALFIFHRDLRLQDNTGLIAVLKAAEEVILSFIFTPEQIEHNPYKGKRCLQFMLESLEDLEEAISAYHGRLYLFYGKPEEIVKKCIEKLNVEGVFCNRDYTPYSIRRDQKIESECNKHSIPFQASHDLLLHPIQETLKADGKPYTVFTPYYVNASKLKVSKPCRENPHHTFYNKSISFSEDRSLYKKILSQRDTQVVGGRTTGLKLLKHLDRYEKYPQEKDFPALEKTTHLSAHLKFTTCSVREVYEAILTTLGTESQIIRSLYWRDFFTLIAFHFPHVFGNAFKTKFQALKWVNDPEMFKAWCEGKTGFPIVDAGMRELNQTGFMHNRVRMITGSFLVKDLHVDWQWGEKYFAQHLIDYDPSVNNGNWQWVASSGCDAQPYFRIFNPWLQQKKFDENCEYIKQWIPELRHLPQQVIHAWNLKKNHNLCLDYPYPIIDHAIESKIALETYREASYE
jgi:deoxyribodipyrimidine photo-lyase